MSKIRAVAGLAGLTAILLLQACGKAEEAKAPAVAPSAAASSPVAPAASEAASAVGALSITDKLTVYHKAAPAERSALIPAALAAVKDEIDKKGKSDADVAGEILPCMNSINDQVSDADRATQTVLDLVAVCLVQTGFKK